MNHGENYTRHYNLSLFDLIFKRQVTPPPSKPKHTHGFEQRLLLAAIALLAQAGAVLALIDVNRPTAVNDQAVLPSAQTSIAAKRFLRTDKPAGENDSELEERQGRVLADIVTPGLLLDHVGNVVTTGLQQPTLLNKIDSISQYLQN
ncbi:hypothetical protein ON010_g281 [Phytophthora cinnamomi]|nr:hypothetical protein ON010_g281 [Phytophthora cinnamomi]